jgi:uncharacterized protein YjiS (DUF1127 family)
MSAPRTFDRISFSAPMPLLSRLLLRAAVTVAVWDMRRRTRAGLAALDPHLLKDIGVDALTAADETGKAFWQR